MENFLVVIAHPALSKSRINAAWADSLRDEPRITLHDIHATARDGSFDIAAEQKLVEAHDRIVFQFPLFWYSCPPLLSTWLMEVWQRGWAYGPGGRALRLKTLGIAISTGSNGDDYRPGGRYHHSLEEITTPFELLARHTGMHYLPLFSLTGVREVTDAALAQSAAAYRDHILSAAPAIIASGADDDRARTVYPGDPGAQTSPG